MQQPSPTKVAKETNVRSMLSHHGYFKPALRPQGDPTMAGLTDSSSKQDSQNNKHTFQSLTKQQQQQQQQQKDLQGEERTLWSSATSTYK